MFLVSWAALEDSLTLLAATPEMARLVPETVSALRKAQADGEQPSRLLLRILGATTFLADPAASPDSLTEAGAMT
jgi:hypothetical protein